MIHEHPKVVIVSGADPSQPPQKAKVVDADVRFTCQDTVDHLILMINQAIYVPEAGHCLLCPMQCWTNGVEINKVLKFLTTNPTTLDHSIMIADSTDTVNLYTIHYNLRVL
jgi:hypothetical protein